MSIDNQNDLQSAVGREFCFQVQVVKVNPETSDITSFELANLDSKPLPAFTAGAHIDVWISDNECRQYSLCSSPSDTSTYKISVLREEDGLGGSVWVHENLQEGQIIEISAPRNLFPLSDDAESHLLLAGGIGVSPLISMIYELEAKGARYKLHFCTRSVDKTPFMAFLNSRIDAGLVHLYHDEGDPSAGLNIAALLSEQTKGTHLYYCGPAGFMAAAKDASSSWVKGTVHFEYFSSPDENVDEVVDGNQPFQVKLKETGEVFDVPPDQSIVEVLRENGIPVDTQCEDGFCATCMTRYVSGEPEHRDSVLDEDDRTEFVLICCARSKTPVLELDL